MPKPHKSLTIRPRLAVGMMLLMSAVAGAKPQADLTSSEAEQAREAAFNYLKPLLGSGESRLHSVHLITTDSGEPRLVEVVFYNRASKRGAAAVVELPNARLVRKGILTPGQIPLTDEEDAIARRVLSKKGDELRKMLGDELSAFKLSFLPFESHVPSAPCQDDRCLRVIFGKNDQSVGNLKVIVDLTNESVLIAEGNPSH